MPRLSADGPSLISSADGRWVALAIDDHVSLYDAIKGEERSQLTLPVAGPTEVGFTTVGASRLVTITRTEESTVLHSFTVPQLEPIARRDFPGAWRPLTIVGERVLLRCDEPEDYQLAVLTPKLIVSDAIPLRGQVRFAARAPEERLLVDARTALEFWDAPTRRALFRLTLPLPPAPTQIGFAHKGRLLWVTEEAGRLEVFRFSDGRQQMKLELGGQIVTVDGKLDSARILLAHRTGDTVELILIDLAQRERQQIALDPGARAFCLVEGAAPAVAMAGGGKMIFAPLTPLPARTTSLTVPAIETMRPEPTGEASPLRWNEATSRLADRPAASGANSGEGGDRASSRLSAWRARLRGGAQEAAPAEADDGLAGVDTPAPDEDEKARPPETIAVRSPVEPTQPLKRSVSPFLRDRKPWQTKPSPPKEDVERGAVERPAAVERVPAPVSRSLGTLRPRTPMARPPVPAARPSPAPSPPPPVEETHAEATDETTPDTPSDPGPWRETLADWAETALTSKLEQEPPTIDRATTLGLVIARYGLDEIAARALAALYGAWLLGRAEEGLPIATLARVIEDRDNWLEALGRGALARAALVENRRGRVRLRPIVGRLLDGFPPRAPIVIADPIDNPLDIDDHRITFPLEGETANEVATRISAAVASSVALLDGRQLVGRRLATRMRELAVEARIFNALPLVWVDSELEDGEWRTVLHGSPLVIVASPFPPELAQLPTLAL